MQRILLIVAMLLLATPALAGVTITATQQGTDGNVVVSYTATANVRAFAFDIDVNGGVTIDSIHDYNVGDTNGYGIFPGRFRDYYNSTSPNWVDPCYTPVAPSGDPGAQGGLRTAGITVELGSLGADLSSIRSGTLFSLDFNSHGVATDANLTLTVNTTRGGIVDDNGYAFVKDVNLTLNGCALKFTIPCINIPAIVGGNMTDANTALTTAGFTNPPSITYECNETYPVPGTVCRQDTGCVPSSTIVHYVVSTGHCCINIPAILGDSMTDANSAIRTVGLTGTIVITYECNCVYPLNHVIRQDTGCVAPGATINYVVNSCTSIPNILNSSMTDANTALTTAGFTNPPSITYECNNTYASGKVCRQDTGCVPPSTIVHYVVSLGSAPAAPGAPSVPISDADGAYTVSWTASAGATSYQLDSNDPCAGTTIYPSWVNIYSGTALSFSEKVGGGKWLYRVRACNACGCSAYVTGPNTCVVSECLKSTATGYADWVKWRHPACWCFRRQCRGDTDGKKAGTWVSLTPDLTNFKAAYTQSDANLVALACPSGTTGRICGICADLNHAKQGTRVSLNPDLTTFKQYYTQPDVNVPCCDTAAPAGDCTLLAGDPYNFWTN
jgi:beta-lactam-binding protein with PASTA domain